MNEKTLIKFMVFGCIYGFGIILAILFNIAGIGTYTIFYQ